MFFFFAKKWAKDQQVKLRSGGSTNRSAPPIWVLGSHNKQEYQRSCIHVYSRGPDQPMCALSIDVFIHPAMYTILKLKAHAFHSGLADVFHLWKYPLCIMYFTHKHNVEHRALTV